MIGTTIAHFKITAKIGEGGMGVVYRATDSKLNREVALKVLPQVFAQDEQRMGRFKREAQVLASLNHPNIAQIYGLETRDSESAAGAESCLIMELVEGEDLSQRIARGPIPLEESLQIALQIARALENAHEKGIIHRDLKPANIKLTPTGEVKVLDFGLAKALESTPEANSNLTHSPTLTMAATQAGIILGTAAYMSPEQARGQPVDHRTDIWAFGAIVYEMLTARQVFAGKTVSDVLAKVLERQPDWDALPSGIPLQLGDLLRRTFIKERDRRLQAIGDARIALLEAQETPVSGSLQAEKQRIGWMGSIAVHLIVAALAGLVGFWLGSTNSPTDDVPVESVPILSEIVLPTEMPLAFGITHAFDPVLIALSPDGSNLVFVGRSADGRSQLFLRKMGDIEVTPIPGTEDAIHPFFSPDGQWVGFLTLNRVRKVSLQGGGAVTLCQAANATRASWAKNGTIYFAQNEGRFLWAVPENGGEAWKIMDLDSIPAVLSQVLPDGRAALLVADSGGISQDFGEIYLLPLDTLEPRVLVEGGYDARYLSSGHLLFARTGSLMAVPFDLDEMSVQGDPVPVLNGVRTESFFSNVQLAVSDGGTVVYSPGADAAVGRIARVDRDGNSQILPVPERIYGVFDLSPDGEELAIQVGDVSDFVWVYDIPREEGRRLASPNSAGWPRWSPDGQMIASHVASQVIELRSVSSQTAHRTIGGEGVSRVGAPGDWSPDGSVLSFDGSRARGIGFASTQVDDQIRWMNLGDDVVYWGPTFSPDGQWVAYASDETGQFEIWIRSYPDLDKAFQISTAGGMEPVWLKSGELYFHTGNRWMATKVELGPEPHWLPPALAFETEYMDTPGVSFDVSADGKYLYVLKSAVPPVPTQLHVIHNWFAELKRLAPAKEQD